MEKWQEFYSEEQLKKVQKIELENLKVLLGICNKLNIECFAYGGTLLGVVRHNGFIPWDDDIDIAMMRDDYYKFVSQAKKYLPEGYYLQTPYEDKNSPFSYSKLRNKNTKYVEYGYHNLKTNHGIYIDIYPIDKLPCDKNKLKMQHKVFKYLSKCYAWRQCHYISNTNRNIEILIKRGIKTLLSLILKIIPQKLYIKLIDHVATYFNTSNEKCLWGNLYYPEPKNVLDKIYPLIKCKFEEIDIKIPQGWEKHLVSRYGDYLTLPAPEKRIGHKPYVLEIKDAEL